MSEPSIPRTKREFLKCLKEARIGDPVAQYDVALMYANGAGINKNLEQALHWTRLAAEKGHVSAQYLLARSYQQGLGTNKDPVKALSWYQRAAERGNEKATLKLATLFLEPQNEVAFMLAMDAAKAGLPQAQMAVADQLSKGLGVMQNIDEANQWYRAAAEQGLASAQMAMGKACEFGIGMAADLGEASRWYRQAAAQGMPAAQLALQCLDESAGRSNSKAKKPSKRAISRERRVADSRWITYAAKGSTEDFYYLGIMFESGIGVEQSAKQARLWYLKAAERGHVDAMVPLARMVAESNPAEAARWFARAAEHGVAEAQYGLGKVLLAGVGVPKDDTLACTWFAQAARAGHAGAKFELAELMQTQLSALALPWILAAAHSGIAQAQYVMGELSATGDGIQQDWGQACRWYQLAAEQEHAEAQCALAMRYSVGVGVEPDVAMAFHWFERAAAQGNARAQWNLGQLLAVGIPGVPSDSKHAMLLCKRAATAGFVPAQATLGTLFARAKKYDRAVDWWAKAAGQNDQEAQYNLANAYRGGLGIKKDDAVSLEWLLAAAMGGLAAAQARAGLAYATGDGAVIDPIESAKWFILAAERDDASAVANKLHSKEILSPAQWTEAERRASKWMPVQPK
jgi:TPR repeat protein